MDTGMDLAERSLRLLNETDLVADTDSGENITNCTLVILVSDIILKLGIPAHITGYSYLREAIIIKVNDPAAKRLYPSVAKEFTTSVTVVERAMRHAIKEAWKRKDQPYRDRSFPHPYFRFEKKPTNLELIAMAAEYVLFLHALAIPSMTTATRTSSNFTDTTSGLM